MFQLPGACAKSYPQVRANAFCRVHSLQCFVIGLKRASVLRDAFGYAYWFFFLSRISKYFILEFLKCTTVCMNDWRRAHDTLGCDYSKNNHSSEVALCSLFHMRLTVFNKLPADCLSALLLLQDHRRKQGRDNGKKMSSSSVLKHVCVDR